MQIIFHKRAIKYRSLLRKMIYKDKGSYESSPPCSAKACGKQSHTQNLSLTHTHIYTCKYTHVNIHMQIYTCEYILHRNLRAKRWGWRQGAWREVSQNRRVCSRGSCAHLRYRQSSRTWFRLVLGYRCCAAIKLVVLLAWLMCASVVLLVRRIFRVQQHHRRTHEPRQKNY